MNKPKYFLFVVLLSYIIFEGFCLTANAKEKALWFNFEFQGKSHSFQYLLFLPENYTKKESEIFPLIFSLHGAGENGDNIERLKRHGIPKIAEKQHDFSFIVLAPQVPVHPDFDVIESAWMALLDEVSQTYRVDKKRIYITGYSQGGFLTWVLSMKYPDRFAAVVPIAGGGDLAMLCKAMNARNVPCKHASSNNRSVCRLKNTPVRVFHGSKDPVVPAYASKALVNQLLRCNGNVQFTLYPGVGHDSWTRAYNTPEFYDWLLSNSLAK